MTMLTAYQTQKLIESGNFARVIEWQIQGYYGKEWECECCEDCYAEASQRLTDYVKNGPGRYRLIAVCMP